MAERDPYATDLVAEWTAVIEQRLRDNGHEGVRVRGEYSVSPTRAVNWYAVADRGDGYYVTAHGACLSRWGRSGTDGSIDDRCREAGQRATLALLELVLKHYPDVAAS